MADVFYYWKNWESDLKARRVGWLRSDRAKLRELSERHPDCIWAFKTPKGDKGSLQLVAKLRWCDRPSVAVPKIEAESIIYYEPSRSVLYADTAAPERVETVTSVIRRHFPRAFSANFQGDNGVQLLENDAVLELKRLTAGYCTEPFPLPSPPGSNAEAARD